MPAVTGPRPPRLLTAHRGLDRSEWVTTVAAFVISSACYLRWRHPYLARGVVGDLAGLTLLSLVAWTRRRLLRSIFLVVSERSVPRTSSVCGPMVNALLDRTFGGKD